MPHDVANTHDNLTSQLENDVFHIFCQQPEEQVKQRSASAICKTIRSTMKYTAASPLVMFLSLVCIAQCCVAFQIPGVIMSKTPPQQQVHQQSEHQLSRRDAMVTALGRFMATSGVMLMTTATVPQMVLASDEGGVLTEDEMAARVARKLELQRKSRGGGGGGGGGGSTSAASSAGIPSSAYTADIRSDINPEAGTDLRSRSFVENTKIALEKQEEMAKRDKKQKREDMCEMLGRGC
ncbi:hypothetical protein MHU86_17095 [Fragilaria crotonensis]|nr:hypothetical protein MHU86_17095 [Fragilaria crotonensis]